MVHLTGNGGRFFWKMRQGFSYFIILLLTWDRTKSFLSKQTTLSPAYNEHFDAKKSARYSWVLVVTKLVVAGILLIVQCSYQGTILSHLMSTNN